MLQQVIDHEGLVFGASQKECGNYRNLDIECAKRECRRYLDCLNAKPTHDFTYAQ
jgi:S-ribosylhomocysteine lyase